MDTHKKSSSITFLLFNLKNNGGNRIVLSHALQLKKRGWNVKIVSLFGKNQTWFQHSIHRISLLSAVFQKHDKLVATFWPTAFVALFIPARERCYFIQGREDEFYTNYILKRLVRATYRLPMRIITTSHYIADGIKKYISPTPAITLIPPCGIDAAVFYSNPSKNFTKAPRILSVVTAYTYPKGIDLLHKAVSTLKKTHPEYKFTLASTEERPYSSVFDDFFTNLTESELASLYRNSDFLLATGRSEGYFLPGLEAMASGVIFITTDSGGVREYAEDGYNAIFVQNLEDLWQQEVIERIWKDKGLMNKLIINGKKTAKEYQWHYIVDRLEKAYNLTHQ